MKEFASGSIFIRTMDGPDGMGVPPGFVVKGHKHNFDHTSIFFNGLWHVRKWSPGADVYAPAADDITDDIQRRGPFHLLIEKDCMHEFTFVGEAPRGIAWCVYSHRTPDGEVVEAYNGWREAYLTPDR